MSGHGKKGRNRSGSSKALDFRDLTLADYANSTADHRKGRIGKAKSSFNVVREVKQLNIQDKTWDEKLEEFEGDYDFVREENEDGEEVFVMKKATRRKKTLCDSMKEDTSSGKTYPLDIWFHIAQYIRPEDTGKFASICKSSWSVVNTPIYWLNLYKRYYKSVSNMPVRLEPEYMVRHHGLKACVVRSLFYMYPPLAARLDQGDMSTPYDLRSRQCISVWQERLNNKWRLCFKMRRKDYLPNKISSGDKPNLMDILEDIFANSDDGCTILQVMSTEKTLPPAVMGLTLHGIQITFNVTCAAMHVQLVFGSGRICNGHLDSTGTVALSLKAVLQVSVLDWWHPRYPHSPETHICVSDDM